MPIQLDKILSDIAGETVLHPSYEGATKKELDDAWMRVGKNNKLSVHEARSIFKVLQKKYEQEKTKRNPSWKLFNLMEKIHQKVEIKEEVKQESEPEAPLEEDEEYEMLEVQEEDEQTASQSTQPPASTGSVSDGDSPIKSLKHSTAGTQESSEKPAVKTFSKLTNSNNTATAVNTAVEEKKLLNTMVSTTPRPSLSSGTAQTPAAAAAAALHKKGITMKKTTPTSGTSLMRASAQTANNNTAQPKGVTQRIGGQMLEVGKTIQLPESIKRKLSEEQQSGNPSKKLNSAQAASTSSQSSIAAGKGSATNTTSNNTVTAQLQIKQDIEEYSTSATPHGINLITIPGNARVELVNGGSAGGACSSTAATVASTSTNGLSPRLEDVDFRNDIIFDAGNGLNGGAAIHKANAINNTSAADGINLGNFDNSLPPTFFKNLCNSSRHEALGLYVANVMNRLQARSAAKLELGILRAIIDVQSDELEQ